MWRGKSVEAWFSGSYWGFTKTLLRNVDRTALQRAIAAGIAEGDLPLNGHLTMISVMTQVPKSGRTTRFLTHEQLLVMFPDIYANFRREGVIPHAYRHAPPSGWQARSSTSDSVPTFVEIFVSTTRANVTIADPWILELFSMYWDYSHHYANDAKNIVRVVMYDGDRRVPVQILIEDVHRHNPALYDVLKQFTSYVQPVP